MSAKSRRNVHPRAPCTDSHPLCGCNRLALMKSQTLTGGGPQMASCVIM
jgi:hypothetical protein